MLYCRVEAVMALRGKTRQLYGRVRWLVGRIIPSATRHVRSSCWTRKAAAAEVLMQQLAGPRRTSACSCTESRIVSALLLHPIAS